MHLRHLVQTCAALAVTLSTPALAGQHLPDEAPDGPDMRPAWRSGEHPGPRYGVDPRARDEWLADCRQRISDYRGEDRGIGGAVIGGVAGGLLGNRIAGRGNRTVGTVAGAAVGAIAGAAIDKAEDRGRDRDECETYIDDYYARYASGYVYPGSEHYPAYGPSHAVPMVMVPVMVQPQKPCVETVTTTE